MDIGAQKNLLDNTKAATPLLSTMFDLLKIHGDEKISTFGLLFLDGLIEEDRQRIESFAHI